LGILERFCCDFIFLNKNKNVWDKKCLGWPVARCFCSQSSGPKMKIRHYSEKYISTTSFIPVIHSIFHHPQGTFSTQEKKSKSISQPIEIVSKFHHKMQMLEKQDPTKT
jgi:hypothetical protein